MCVHMQSLTATIAVAKQMQLVLQQLRSSKDIEIAAAALSRERKVIKEISDLEAEAARSTPALLEDHHPDAPTVRTGTLG